MIFFFSLEPENNFIKDLFSYRGAAIYSSLELKSRLTIFTHNSMNLFNIYFQGKIVFF